MNKILFRLIDISFTGMFSDHHCKCIETTNGSGFKHDVDMSFNDGVLKSSL